VAVITHVPAASDGGGTTYAFVSRPVLGSGLVSSTQHHHQSIRCNRSVNCPPRR